MSSKELMTDVAYKWMSKRKREVPFQKAWEAVVKAMDIPEEKQRKKKSQFYSELSMDPRFVSFEGNVWDLRNRRKFSEVYIDTSEIELGDDEEDDVEIEENEIESESDELDQDSENNKY